MQVVELFLHRMQVIELVYPHLCLSYAGVIIASQIAKQRGSKKLILKKAQLSEVNCIELVL